MMMSLLGDDLPHWQCPSWELLRQQPAGIVGGYGGVPGSAADAAAASLQASGPSAGCGQGWQYGWVMEFENSWWRHQIATFSALLALCEGNPPVTGGFPSHSPVTRSFDVFFDVRLNKQLSRQSRRRWDETPYGDQCCACWWATDDWLVSAWKWLRL